MCEFFYCYVSILLNTVFDFILQLPSSGDLWSIHMDFDTKRLDPWERIIPTFKYSRDIPFFEMLVPTTDTVRFGYLMEKLLAVRHSVLFTGITGVGKVGNLSETRSVHKWGHGRHRTVSPRNNTLFFRGNSFEFWSFCRKNVTMLNLCLENYSEVCQFLSKSLGSIPHINQRTLWTNVLGLGSFFCYFIPWNFWGCHHTGEGGNWSE